MTSCLQKRFFLILFLFLCITIQGQVKVMTWNLMNLGKSKTPEQITYIASILDKADIIAIQEVVTNPTGAQTTAKIHQELNNSTGSKWDYVISEPTQSSPYRSERYVYFFKTGSVKLKSKPYLDQHFAQQIEREPYVATFTYKGKEITLMNFHALPKKHQPETEIKYFRNYPSLYSDHNLVFLGDFNLTQAHSVFNPIKNMGYEPAFTKQKTSLRQKCIQGDCLASEYDNLFHNSANMSITHREVILFFEDFEDLETARKLSDHIPLLVQYNLK